MLVPEIVHRLPATPQIQSTGELNGHSVTGAGTGFGFTGGRQICLPVESQVQLGSRSAGTMHGVLEFEMRQIFPSAVHVHSTLESIGQKTLGGELSLCGPALGRFLGKQLEPSAVRSKSVMQEAHDILPSLSEAVSQFGGNGATHSSVSGEAIYGATQLMQRPFDSSRQFLIAGWITCACTGRARKITTNDEKLHNRFISGAP